MEETPNDVNHGGGTPSGGQPELKNPSNETAMPSSNGDGGEPGDGGTSPGTEDAKRVVNADRFNELLEKSKKYDQMEKDFATSKQDMQNKLDAIARAAEGKTSQQIDDDVAKMAQKWNVQPEFIAELFEVATNRTTKQFEEKLKPLKAHQAQAAYDREFNNLAKSFPEVLDMDADQKKEFQKLALDQRYIQVPLEDVYKIHAHGRPAGKRKTAETSRGGSQGFGGDEPDITNMSLDEFEKYSNNLGKKHS